MTLIARSIVHTDAASCRSPPHDGHQVHRIRVLRALRDRDLAVHVLVEIVEESVVQLSWDGRQFRFLHHDVDSIADALDSGGDVGEWIPRWRVLVLPGRTRRPSRLHIVRYGTLDGLLRGGVHRSRISPGRIEVAGLRCRTHRLPDAERGTARSVTDTAYDRGRR